MKMIFQHEDRQIKLVTQKRIQHFTKRKQYHPKGLVCWGSGLGGSFNSIVGTNKLTVFHLCYGNILLNYNIEHAMLVCVAQSNQSTLRRLYLLPQLIVGISPLTGDRIMSLTEDSACDVFQDFHLFQSSPGNFYTFFFTRSCCCLFTYTNNAIDIRKISQLTWKPL